MPEWDVSFPIPVSSSRLFKVRWTHLKPVGHCREDLVFEWRGAEKLPAVTKGNFFLNRHCESLSCYFQWSFCWRSLRGDSLISPQAIHVCVSACAHATAFWRITRRTIVLCVCVSVCVQSAVIQAYLQPRGLAADCWGQNSWPLRSGADQCPGVLLSPCSRKDPSRRTGQLPIHTCARALRTFGGKRTKNIVQTDPK